MWSEPVRQMPTVAKQNVRTKSPEKRRNDIMNAAESLLVEQGVAATTVDQITAGANVAKGTFYLYFASKDELLGALGDRFGRKLLDGIQAAVAKQPEDDLHARLSAWAKACALGYLDSIRVHDALFWDQWPRTREGLVDNIVIDDLHRMLSEGKKVGAWSIVDTRAAAVFLFTGIHSVVDNAYLKQKRVNRAQLARTVEDLLLRCAGARR